MESYFYCAVFQDVPCDHRHRTWEAAHACARKTIAAAKSAAHGASPKFGHPADSDSIAQSADIAAEMGMDEADLCIRKYHSCGMRVGG